MSRACLPAVGGQAGDGAMAAVAVALKLPKTSRAAAGVRALIALEAAVRSNPRPRRQHDLSRPKRKPRLRRQVQEIDPAWKPRTSLSTPDSIEGDIAAAEGEAQEAQARLREFAQQEPESLIGAYRRQQGLDLLGDPIWSREQNTVATCKVGDVPLIGTNSGSITYTQRDQAAAERWRDTLVQNYPTVMNTEKIGGFPNDAVFHAEATCLFRAARANGGTLAGQTIEVHVDRPMCFRCKKVLPYIGLELGNPTVTFFDPDGLVRTMRDGVWVK
jgi:hypothetical protein